MCAAVRLVPMIKGHWQLRRAAERFSGEDLPWGRVYLGDPEAAFWEDF